jgi:cytochrome P450
VREGSPVADEVKRIYETEGWAPVHSLVNNDPPDHKRFRSFVDKAFSPAHVKTSLPLIRSIAQELVDALPVGTGFDAVAKFALQMPLRVFAKEFGVPTKDLSRWDEWARVLLEQYSPDVPPEREIELTRKVCEMQRYLAGRIGEVRAAPEDNLLTHLVQASDEGRMNMGELLSVFQMLVPAGHETTANGIASGIKRIAEDAELQATLRANPQRIPAFVEEVLRLDAPIQGLYRRVLKDTDVDGFVVEKDSTVVLSWGAANRDPQKFADPEKLDLDRANANQHLSFGAGAHFCVGNQLARSEMKIAFELLLSTFSSIVPDLTIGARTDSHFFAYGPACLGIVLR